MHVEGRQEQQGALQSLQVTPTPNDMKVSNFSPDVDFHSKFGESMTCSGPNYVNDPRLGNYFVTAAVGLQKVYTVERYYKQ